MTSLISMSLFSCAHASYFTLLALHMIGSNLLTWEFSLSGFTTWMLHCGWCYLDATLAKQLLQPLICCVVILLYLFFTDSFRLRCHLGLLAVSWCTHDTSCFIITSEEIGHTGFSGYMCTSTAGLRIGCDMLQTNSGQNSNRTEPLL